MKSASKRDTDIDKLISLAFIFGRFVREGSRKSRTPFSSLLRFEVLQYAKDNNQPTMRDIGRYLCITPPATTLLIESMVEEKLLSRIFDKKDRRIIRIGLTKSGKRFIAHGVKGKVSNLKKLFSALNPKEKRQMVTMMEKVIKSRIEND